jgi:hypothetical protein
MTASHVRGHSSSGSVGEMKPATMPSAVWRDFFLMGAIDLSQYLRSQHSKRRREKTN